MSPTPTHVCAACHKEVRVTALWYVRPGQPKQCLCEHCVEIGFAFSEQGVLARYALRERLAAVLRLRLAQIEERT